MGSRVTVFDIKKKGSDRSFALEQLILTCEHSIVRKIVKLPSGRIWEILGTSLSLLLNNPKFLSFLRKVGSPVEDEEFVKLDFPRRGLVHIIYGNFQNIDYFSTKKSRFETEVSEYLNALFPGRSSVRPGRYISAHVRAGDYDLNSLGRLSSDYYLEIFSIEEKLPIYIYCESKNDIPWELQNLLNLQIFDASEADSWKLIIEMSRANVIVCANSTLSWWAGRLGSLLGAKVYLPSPWFRGLSDIGESLYPTDVVKHRSSWREA